LRLIRLALIGWFVTVISIGSTVLYGRARTEQSPLEAYGFSKCNDRLCFLGIEPGVTRWSRALDILGEHGAVQSKLSGNVFLMDHTRIDIDYNPQTQLVDFISPYDQSGMPLPITVGVAIQYLGIPCGFQPINPFQPNAVILFYPHENMVFYLDTSVLYPSNRAAFVQLYDNQNCDKATTWPGFVSYERYYALYFKS
jgi:hypothetical protein